MTDRFPTFPSTSGSTAPPEVTMTHARTAHMQGHIHNDGLSDYLQLLASTNRSARITAHTPTGDAHLHFMHGQLTHARFGPVTGESAVREILRAHGTFQGHLTTDDGAAQAPERNIPVGRSLQNVLLDAALEVDHAAQEFLFDPEPPAPAPVPLNVPDAGVIPTLVTPLDLIDEEFSAAVWRVMNAVNGERSLTDIGAAVGLDVPFVQQVIATQTERGYVTVQRPALPAAFWADVLDHLRQVVGPAAALLMDDAADDLGIQDQRVYADQAAPMLDVITASIPPAKQPAFQAHARALLDRHTP